MLNGYLFIETDIRTDIATVLINLSLGDKQIQIHSVL